MFNQQDQSISNPFNANNIWSNNNSSGIINNGSNPNPFNTTDPFKVNGMNGMNQNFQQMIFPQTVNGTSWVPNPFKVDKNIFLKIFCLFIFKLFSIGWYNQWALQ